MRQNRNDHGGVAESFTHALRGTLGAVLVLCTGCTPPVEPSTAPTAEYHMTHAPSHTNRLAKESSPYLLQHATNPVDWYPWGEEALARARKEDRLIFLSIGYSACHWCHVMAHESFEDADIAALLNQNFISIKVDREERPDLDDLYMHAVQMMTRQGGWPLTVFLTPDLRPVYGGTYFPPDDRYGRPGFKRVVTGLAEAWQTRRVELQESAEGFAHALTASLAAEMPTGTVSTANVVETAVTDLRKTFDATWGGQSNPAMATSS